MALGNRDHERFWIALTVRVAFGFMFLIAAMNIFFSDWTPDPKVSFAENVNTNIKAFADGLSKPYEASWINWKSHGDVDPATGAPGSVNEIGLKVIWGFLYSMPFILSVLSIMLITGLLYRYALRASALFLVVLGLGKYLADFKSGNTLTTLQDFMYAMFITLALFALSREPVPTQDYLGPRP